MAPLASGSMSGPGPQRVRLAQMAATRIQLLPVLLACCLLASCSQGALNNPYPARDRGQNILYSFFNERPKHLDPVQSYFENEIRFTAQIYMPPLQYHYLKRPYQLTPFAAAAMPSVTYFGLDGEVVPEQAGPSEVADEAKSLMLSQARERLDAHDPDAPMPDEFVRFGVAEETP